MDGYVISNKMVDHASIALADTFSDIEERISKLDKDVDKTIRAIKVNIINKKKKFRVRRYKSYYGRF